jgi:Zn-dependent M28 family amino/carboxypeptidase
MDRFRPRTATYLLHVKRGFHIGAMKMTRKSRYRLSAVLVAALAGAGGLIALVTQPWVAPAVNTAPSLDAPITVNPDALKAHVKKLSVDLYPRSFAHARNLYLAGDYIENAFRKSGAEVSVQAFSADGEPYRNIIAHFGPKSGPLLVIGAHYDSVNATDGVNNSEGAGDTHGADDNASGIAGLLELARLLGRHPPGRPVELAAYTLEEPPYFRTQDMGSAHHARLLREQGQEVTLMISLEMIGYFSDAPDSQDYPFSALSALYPDRGDYIALVGKFGDFGVMRRVKALMQGASPLPVASINAPPLVPGIDFSDHLSFWAAGYPAIMVTDTAFNRNKEYHQAGDTWERLDYARMAEVVQDVYAVAQGVE